MLAELAFVLALDGLCFTVLVVVKVDDRAWAGGCVESEELFERGEPVARACAWVVTECDPLEFLNVVGALGRLRLLAGS